MAGNVPAKESAPTQTAVSVTARDHFQSGETALFDRKFAKAIEEYQLALDQKDDLEPRERALARLGIAIALPRRLQAQEIAREINKRWPDDPDFQRIRREFAPASEEPRGFGRRRQRP